MKIALSAAIAALVGIILGAGAIYLYQIGGLPLVKPVQRQVDIDSLYYKSNIAYVRLDDAARTEEKPFTGTAIQSFENGGLKLAGEFRQGKPDGLWQLWHDNNTLWLSSHLSASGFSPDREKCSLLIDESGQVCLDNFTDLKRQDYKRWLPDGRAAGDGSFKNGKEEVPSLTWHESGQVELEWTYKDGKQEGLYRVRDEDGQLLFEWTYGRGKSEGLARVWHENEQLSFEGTYKDGKLEGPYRMWYENGQVRREETYKDDQREGLARVWREDGKLSFEGTYRSGRLEGLARMWHANGQPSFEGMYKDDKREGLVRTWDEEGQLSFEGTFKNNVEVKAVE